MFKLSKLKKSVNDDNSIVIYYYEGRIDDRKVVNIWDNIVNKYKNQNKLNLDDCLDILDIFYDEILMYKSTINKSLDIVKLFTNANFKIYHIKHAEGKVIKRIAILGSRTNNKITDKGIIRPIVRFEYVDDSDSLVKLEEIIDMSKDKNSIIDRQSE